jgi:hypothetical protein
MRRCASVSKRTKLILCGSVEPFPFFRQITRYSGVDPINPIDTAAGNIGRSKIATTSSITTTAANDEVVTVYALHVGSNNFAGDFFSTPTGMTEKYDSSYTTAGPTIASDDTIRSTVGATGSISSTISGNPNQQRDWVAQTIALHMQSPTTLATGLVAYWKLDGDSSDATGNGHDGSDTAITYSTANGIINQGAGTVRENSSCISIPDSTALKPTGSFSINYWEKGTDTADAPTAFQTYAQNTNIAGILPYLSVQAGIVVGNNTGVTPNTNYVRIAGTTNVQDGNWHMITNTYDGTTVKIYVDGNSTPEASQAWTGGVAYQATNYVRIGCENLTGTNHPNSFNTTAWDEIGVWTRALSTSEISALYNSRSGNQYPF